VRCSPTSSRSRATFRRAWWCWWTGRWPRAGAGPTLLSCGRASTTTGHNHQIGASLDGRLLFITDPLPGKTHDARAFRENGLDTCKLAGNGIGEKGYLGSGLVTPFRKPPGRELLPWQKEFNTTVNSLRAAVERAIAMKTWRILHTDCRRPRARYGATFRAVRALIFFQAAESL